MARLCKMCIFAFSKSNIMAGINDLIKSEAYQRFMKRLLWWSVPTFVIGIVFLLTKMPGGNVITIAGGGCLIIWTVFFLFGKLVTRE